ncbi:hypothetical protein CBM2587_A210011 [Cupriavidus taiwanensis]|uniref:Uncharacterized protein n=1 Tax=Cupriavidus taiwanensis TaxID=164546 RepID=A0A975X0M1_9BURK|nr:hypothetical protein CBM2587_A210011 [Cupriavidus taiwanensis]
MSRVETSRPHIRQPPDCSGSYLARIDEPLATAGARQLSQSIDSQLFFLRVVCTGPAGLHGKIP